MKKSNSGSFLGIGVMVMSLLAVGLLVVGRLTVLNDLIRKIGMFIGANQISINGTGGGARLLASVLSLIASIILLIVLISKRHSNS